MKDTKKAEADQTKSCGEYLKAWMREIEELIIQNENGKFYQAVKWMTKEYQPRMNSCKDKNRKEIKGGEEVLGR
jgi:TorA maturation chaperone TorD